MEEQQMFKNTVFKPSVNTVKWLKSAGIRALKTMAQTGVSMLTVGQAVMEINWMNVLSVSLVAGVISILTSIGGIPEVTEEE
jgi:hypothetical protein